MPAPGKPQIKNPLKKHTCLLTLLTCSCITAGAQNDSIWKHTIQTGLNLSQASFSNNWKGGGINSFAYGSFINSLNTYEGTYWSFNSDLQLALGYVNTERLSVKSADRIFYDFKAGYRLARHWDAFASVNFMSQFANGYFYGKKKDGSDSVEYISSFMSPGYLTSSVGVEYKPVDYFWARLGLGTLRQTFVLSDYLSARKAYGMEHAGDHLRNQLVLQLILNYDKEIFRNVNLKMRSMTLWDYIKSPEAGSMVQRFDAGLVMKVNRYINANLQGVLLYDYDQDKEWQYSQLLSLGVLWSWTRGR